MGRFRLTISYDGTDFNGWQRQPNGRTVQGVIEKVFGQLERNRPVSVVAAGRTDSGVHATGQVAHVDLAHAEEINDLHYRVNRMLPPDLCVTEMARVPDRFHARFSACRREYRYQILRRRDPFRARYSWELEEALDPDRLEGAARQLLGAHDFTALSKVNPDTPNMICDLRRLEVGSTGDGHVLIIESDRFLYGMIRLITGLLVDIGRGRRPVEDAEAVLSSKDRTRQSQAAPAAGLTFSRVWYPELKEIGDGSRFTGPNVEF